MWTSTSDLQCKSPRGVRGSQSLAVTAGIRARSLTTAMTFDASKVMISQFQSVQHNSILGSPCESANLVFTASCFFAVLYSAQSKIGHTQVAMTRWLSDSSLQGRASESAAGRSLAIQITAGSSIGSLSASCSIDVPSLIFWNERLGARNLPVVDGAILSFPSTGVRLSHLSARGRAGGSDCESSAWRSDSALLCHVMWGVGAGLGKVVLSVFQMSASVSHVVSYDACSLSRGSTTNMKLKGGKMLTVFVKDFGAVDSSRSISLHYTASPASLWRSTTAISSLACAGAGNVLALRITAVEGVVRSRTAMLSYDSPEVTCLVTCNAPPKLDKLASTVIYGASFGVVRASAASRTMLSASPATVWISDTVVTSQSAAGFNARDAVFSLTVQRQLGTRAAFLTFDAPIVFVAAHRENIFLVVLPPRPNFGAAGQQPLTIRGANFGRYDSSAAARMGGTSASATRWQLDSQLLCRAPLGIGDGLALVATVSFAFGGTLSAAWSYNLPALTALDRYNAPSGVGAGVEQVEVMVMGENFGVSVFSEDSRAGGSACAVTYWMSNSHIVCKLAQGFGRYLAVVHTVALLAGTSKSVLSFDSHTLFDIRREAVGRTFNLASASDRWLVLVGAGFGASDISGSTRVGGTCAESTSWNSATELSARHASGSSLGHSLVVSLATLSQSRASVLSFDSPLVTAVYPYNMPARGNSNILVSGSAFGAADFTSAVRLGHTSCMFSAWTSESSITCKAPAGSAFEQATIKLTVHAGPAGTTPSPHSTFSYNTAPNIKGLHPNHAPTQGGDVLTVTGERLSNVPGMELQIWSKGPGGIRMLTKLCHSLHLDSACTEGIVGLTRQGVETNLTFVVPPGVGEDLMLVYYDESAGLPMFEKWQPTFSYSAPAIHSFTFNGQQRNVSSVNKVGSPARAELRLLTPLLFAAAAGNRQVTITGSSFGGPGGIARVVIGDAGSMSVVGTSRGTPAATLAALATKAAGAQGHTKLVFSVPKVDLSLLPGGMLRLQMISVLLDERPSAPVIAALSVTQNSLPCLMTLDTDYDTVRSSPEAVETFTSTFQSAIMSVVLGADATASVGGEKGSTLVPRVPWVPPAVSRAQQQQVLVTNMTRGSTRVEFVVLDSADGSFVGAAGIGELLAWAHARGTLAPALITLGNVTNFRVEGFEITTTSTTTTPTPTTSSTTTTPAPTTTPEVITTTTPPPTQSFLVRYAVPIIGASTGAGVLLLFSGLVVLIRRSLKSDEDLIKNAFSVISQQSLVCTFRARARTHTHTHARAHTHTHTHTLTLTHAQTNSRLQPGTAQHQLAIMAMAGPEQQSMITGPFNQLSPQDQRIAQMLLMQQRMEVGSSYVCLFQYMCICLCIINTGGSHVRVINTGGSHVHVPF